MVGRRREQLSSCKSCLFCCVSEHSCPSKKKQKSTASEKRTGAVLKTRTNNGDLYEDTMLLVKDQPLPTRKRGRPKKVVTQISPVVRSTPEVIYVPSVRDDRRYVPFVTSVNRACPGPLPGQIRHTIRCVIQPTSTAVTRPLQPPRPKHKDDRIDWPGDLKELVDTWDNLPESNTRDVVKWLQTSLQHQGYPHMVRNIHHMMCEWDESLENKIHQIGSWWLGSPAPPSTSVTPAVPTLPKVVVEAQPNPHQLCSQWSSMADNDGKQQP
ncbi:hypothetical protein J6590_040910 [Homalodisca vitripennis]|nr:hypothetical protein J6590_040910 [Homalodisca vitripennis]